MISRVRVCVRLDERMHLSGARRVCAARVACRGRLLLTDGLSDALHERKRSRRVLEVDSASEHNFAVALVSVVHVKRPRTGAHRIALQDERRSVWSSPSSSSRSWRTTRRRRRLDEILWPMSYLALSLSLAICSGHSAWTSTDRLGISSLHLRARVWLRVLAIRSLVFAGLLRAVARCY